MSTTADRAGTLSPGPEPLDGDQALRTGRPCAVEPGAAGSRESHARLRTALAAYALIRLTGMVLLYFGAHALHHDFTTAVTVWDGRWYKDIVEHAYTAHMPLPYDGHPPQNLAFLPLYPFVVKAVTLFGLPVVHAGLLVSLGSGLAAACGMFRLGELVHSRRTGLALVLVWGVVPQAVIESMFYTESLFTALAVWCLYTLLRRRWLTAGALCLFAGLTRANAVALIVPVCVTALSAVVAARRGPGSSDGESALGENDWKRPLACALMAPAGLVGFLAYVAFRTHRLDGWYHIENQLWDQRVDDGSATFHSVVSRLLGLQPAGFADYVVIALLFASVVMTGLLLVRRVPWQLTAYSAIGVLIALSSGSFFFDSKARFLLPFFPLLLPIATLLGRLPRWALTALIAVFALIGGVYGVYIVLLNDVPL